MKNLIWIPVIFLLLGFSCEDSENPRTDVDLAQLEKEIIALSESVSCTNANDWKFTAMGSKACGGPVLYIAYHKSVEKEFLSLVQLFTQTQKEFNMKNDVVSDCRFITEPKSVTCEGGKPILVY